MEEIKIEIKICKGTNKRPGCNEEKTLDCFYVGSNGKHENLCKPCKMNYISIWQHKNMERTRETKRKSELKNREDYRETKNAQSAKWRSDNPDTYRQSKNKSERKRKANDPTYALMTNISSWVGGVLRSNGGSKNGKSSKKELPWTPEQFWEYFENLFKLPENLDKNDQVWMTRENRGLYRKKIWDENDSSTWTWQLDHIVPHSNFPYTSLEDPLFKQCWDLSNLRPLRADVNIIDGARRTRHNKKDK